MLVTIPVTVWQNIPKLSGSKRQPFMISIAFVGQGVEQGLARMACLCAVMSGAQQGTHEGRGLDYLQAPSLACLVPGLKRCKAELSWDWWCGLSMWLAFLLSWQPGSEWEHPEKKHLERARFRRAGRFKVRGHRTHLSAGGVSRNSVPNLKTATVI